MKLPVVWTERARENLYATFSYLRGVSPGAARRWLASVLVRVRRLEHFPESGRKVPELLDWPIPLREIVVGDYRVIYAVRQGRVEVLAVFHGRRVFAPHFPG